MFVEEFDGQSGGHTEVLIVADGSEIRAPNIEAVFQGDYAKDGQDLLITFDGTAPLRVAEYFTYADPADIIAPNGASLTGADVARLAGAGIDTRSASVDLNTRFQDADFVQSDVVPAQVQLTSEAIGQIDTINGVVNVTRANGSTDRVNAGDLVFQNDVVQTGGGSTVSLVFVDGTVFTLAQNSRMVLDELIYNPEGTDNSAAFNLIQGGFVFVAGQVAKIGDMEVNTPTSTIGIRGTTVEVRIVVVNGVAEVVVSLLPDWPDGQLGSIDLFDQNGNFVSTLTDPETSWVVSPIEGETRPLPRAQVVQADTEALVTQTNDVTERAELRLENSGSYIDFDGAGTGDAGPDGGGQAAPGDGAPAPAPGPGAPDGGSGPDGTPQTEPGQEQGTIEGDTEGQELAPPPGEVPAPDVQPDTQGEPQPNTPPEVQPDGDPDTPLETQPDAQGEDDAALQQDGQQDVANADAADPGANIAALALAQLDAQGDGLDLAGVTNLTSPDTPTTELAPGTADPGLGPGTEPVDTGAFGSDPGLGDTSGFGTFAQSGAPSAPPAALASAPPAATPGPGAESGPPQSAPPAPPSLTAEDATSDLPEDTNFTLDLQSRVSGANGSPLTFSTASTPAHGTVELSPDGQLTYTPDTDFAGSDLFTYRVENDQGEASTGTLTFNVTPVNDAPVAMDDEGVSAAFNMPLAIDVTTLLANDTDGDPEATQPLTIDAVRNATGGTAVLAAGIVTFTPDADFSGQAGFSYDMSDGEGGVASATVRIDVRENTPPVAANLTIATPEDAALPIDMLAESEDADGHFLTVTALGTPQNGTVAFDGEGYLYTPDADFFGTDSFSYTIDDGNGGQDSGTITITVAAVNDAPVAQDDTVNTDEDLALTFDVRGNDSDVEGDALTVTGLSNPANGTVVIEADGQLTYTPDADFNGSDSFTYTIADGNGGTATGTVAVVIAAINDAPSAEDDSVATDEDIAVTFDVRGNDSDPDGDALTVSDVGTPANGSVVIEADGQLTYTPDPGFSGTDSFTYLLVDGAGGSASGTVTVAVALVNLPPLANDDSYTTDEDTPLSVDALTGVLANDSDPDGDPISVTLNSEVSNGTLALAADGSFTYTPDADFNGTDSFTYTLQDSNGETNTATVTLSVTPVNDAPIAVDDGGLFTAFNTPISIDVATVLANDSDGDPELNQTLSVLSVNATVGGTVALSGDIITFTPDALFSGQASFTYELSDGAGGLSTGTVTIAVNANTAPVAGDYPGVTTNEDASVYIPFFDNDSDADGDTLSLAALGTPQNGTVAFDGEGYLYTPDADFFGTDSFSYTIDDGNGGQDSGTITITVAAVNDAPVAQDDTVNTDEDLALTFDVRANDSDVEGDALTVTGLSDPANGTVVIEADGQLTYTPDADFNGSDSFTYTIADGNGGTATGTVAVVIAAINDAPSAEDDSVATDEDIAVTFDVRGNDSDPDGDALTVSDVGTPANGSVVIEADGQLTYTPDPGFSGTDSFPYLLVDGAGGSASATVTVAVALVNLPPLANDDSYTTDEDTPLSVDALTGVLANDSDPDGDPISVTLNSEVSNGTLALAADGSFTYTPDADFNGTDSFTYTLQDSNGETNTATVTLSVTPVNDAPIAVDDGGLFTAFNTPISIDVATVLANDSDGDPELNQTLSVLSVNATVGGTVALSGDIITFTPDALFSGQASFTYELSDGAGGLSTGTVTIAVNANTAPVAGDYPGVTTNEDASVYIPFFDNDSDADGDTLSLAALGTPQNGTVAFDGEGYLYTPDADFFGTDSFSYTIDDGNGGQDSGTITITVAAVNDAPVAQDDTVNTDEDLALTFDVRANDSDVEGDALTVTGLSDPANGTVVIEADGQLTYTPDADFNGSDSFTYTIADGNGGTATGTVAVVIAAINDAPSAEDDSVATDEDIAVTFDVRGNDSDPDGDALTVSDVGTPANGSVVIEADGQLTYTPDPGFSGTDSFTYLLVDGAGGSASATVTVAVALVNLPPLANDDSYTTDEDTPLSVDALTGVLANDSDPDGDPISVTLNSDVSNGTLALAADGSFTYTPDANFNGTDSFTYTLQDSNGETNTATVTLSVTPVNDAPIAVDDGGLFTAFNTPISIDVATVLANDSDGDPELTQTLSVLSVNATVGGTVALSGDIITFTPDALFSGQASFTYELSDGAGGLSTGTVTIAVNANTAPVAGDYPGVTTNEDASVYIPFFDNDSDADGDTLSLAALGTPQNGTVAFDGEGYLYTPDADFFGTDSFSYTIDDGNGGQDSGTITITVAAVNDAPVAQDDTVNTDEDLALTFDVRGNDSDVEGDALTVTGLSNPANGTVVIEADGQLTYTPDADFNGSDSFTYTLQDSNGETNSATVTLSVTPVNDPVTLDAVTGDDFIDVDEQLNPITVSGTAEPNGTVTITFGAASATTNVEADGTFTQVFQPGDLPNSSSVQIDITSQDANGNDSGSLSRSVSISQPDNLLTVNVAGAATSYESEPAGFDLYFGDMPDAAFFEINAGVASVRPPTTSTASEIRFMADDGRSFAFTGADLDYAGASGIITGIEIGSPTDPDFFVGTGITLTVAGFVDALNNSIVAGAVDNGPLDAFFGSIPWIYNGSDQNDWIDVNEDIVSDDIFYGNGGNDEADFGLGDDQYFGGSGNDFFYDTDGNNSFSGGEGDIDEVSYANATGAVDANLNTGSAEKSDGTLDTFDDIEALRGSQFADTIQLQDGATLNIARGLGGADTLMGGSGGFDVVAYDRDSRYTANTVGVTVNLAIGMAIDLFGDTDSLSGFETVIATEFADTLTASATGTIIFAGDGNDSLRSGDGNDVFELGAGEDVLLYTQGIDVVQDFEIGQDTLIFSGFALTNFASLVTTEINDGSEISALLTFSDGGSAVSSLTLTGVTAAEITDYIEFPRFFGTEGDDTIELATQDGDEQFIYASEGNDTYVFTNNADESYQELRYNVQSLALPPIVADLDVNAATNTISKGAAGTDSLVDLGQVASWGFGIRGTSGDDVYNVTLSNTDFAFVSIHASGGSDTVNVLGGEGWLRLNAGENGEDVTANLATGVITSSAETFTINEVGDTSNVTYNLRTYAGNDTVIGSSGSDAIILGAGTDIADGGDGYDMILYNRFDVRQGVTVNLETGVATGVWDGQAFNHTLSNFERVRGSAFDDNLTAAESGSHLQAFEGENTLIGGSGQDTLWGGEGNELFDASGGAAETQGFGDLIEPWSGEDTIIGHQGHWESGGGVEIGYWNLTGTGGLQVTLGQDGSGTVVSNTAGVVNDTFTYANYLRATDENDYFVGADSYGAVNESFILAGAGGNDTIIGGGGRENLQGGDGDDLLDAAGGSVDNQTWGDFVRPGTGNDTIIGHQALWESGDGIDLSYDDVDATGGINITVGANGSGTVLSNVAGVVNDTFTYAHFFSGTQQNDLFTGSDHRFEGWTPFGGADTINGGAGIDKLNYDWDGENGGFTGVNVNAQTGIATDPFGDTDVFTSIEEFEGTRFDDTFIGSETDEYFELGEGADDLTYNGGYDFVDDFTIGEDILQFAGNPVTYIGTLDIVPRSTGPGHSFRFDDDFDDSINTAFELTLRDVTLDEMYQLLASMTFTPVNITGTFGRADYFGTPGDDAITIGGNDGDREKIHASAGADTYDLSASTDDTFVDLSYDRLGPVNLTANLDFNQTTNTIDKGVAGTDTIINAGLAANGDGIFLIDGDGNDTYNITLHAVDRSWVGLSQSRGDDIINLTGGVGVFRIDFARDDDDVTGDLATGDFNESSGDSVTINTSGDLTETRIDIRTRNGDDRVFGNDFDNRFILGAGDDFADARGGWDVVRYDRSDVSTGVTASLATGVATGVWDGEQFRHELFNFEEIRGSNFADALIANDLGNRLDGRGGEDVLIGGAGNDQFETNGGFTVMSGGGGDDYYNVFDGENLIIFSGGNDFVDGFDSNKDALQWDSSIAALSFNINEYVFDGDTRVRFDFDDGSGGSFGIDFSSTTLAEANQIVANMAAQINTVLGTTGRDELTGTSGDDDFNLLGNYDEGDVLTASEGNDFIRFTQATETSWYELNYGALPTASITVNLDLEANTGSVDKGAAGFDTLIDPQNADWGINFTGTNGNDTYNVTLNAIEFNWLNFGNPGGSDTINLTGGNGLVRASLYSGDVTADLSQIHLGVSGTMSSTTGAQITIVPSGDLTKTIFGLRSDDGDDNLIGSEFNDRFILGTGTDFADGLGGIDQIRYDRSGVDSAVIVDLEAGTASGIWDGSAFTHTFQNIEVVRGSQYDDQLTALDDDFSELRGRDGNDLLIRSDFAEDWTQGDDGRDTLLQSSSGSFDFSAINTRDHYRDIEVLSFENAGADTVTLSLQNVMDLSSTADSLLEGFFGSDAVESVTVLGDSGDTLTFAESGFSQTSSVSDGEGRTLDVYQYDGGAGILAIVAVDQDVSVDTAAAGG